MSIAYQRIVLESTFKLGNDYENFERERSIVDTILKETSIDYLMLLEEIQGLNKKGRLMPHEFLLSVFVKMADVDKVIELFDQDGTLGYYVDLDEKIVLDVPLSEEAIKEAEAKLEKEKAEEAEDEPIKDKASTYIIDAEELNENTEDNDGEDTIEVTLTNLFIIVIFSLMFITIIAIELSAIITQLKNYSYDVALKIIIVLIIEIPIFVKILKIFKIKKGN